MNSLKSPIMSEEIFESDFDGDEEECGVWPLEVKLTRTVAHIIDYKMFIAARRIQSYWRGHRARKLRDQRWQAAIAIQRWWRGFWLRQHLWDLLEWRLQEALHDRFHLAATRIQALFRGWQVRRHIHDTRSLWRTQTAAAEELLQCLTLRLHHIKRTEYLPGTNSMQEFICTSEIEKLVTMMKFRFHNGRMISMVASAAAEMENQRKHFWGCRYATDMPYAGPNFNQLCEDHLEEKEEMGKEPIDRNGVTNLRLLDIEAEYQAHQRNKHFRKIYINSEWQKRKEYIENSNARQRRVKKRFCKDIIESMRGWRIWSGIGVKINTNIFSSPENLEHFFEQVRPVLDGYGVNCYCVIRAFPAYNCQEAHS